MYKTNYNSDSGSASFSDSIKSLKISRVKNPAKSYFTSPNSKDNKHFNSHEYDLYEYGRIIDTEALVARAFQKKKTLIFREGFNIKSENRENLEYVKRRIEEISYMSKTSFRKILRELAQNLVSFHNMYLVKVRKKDASSGKVRKYRGGIEVDPVAGWFCLPTESVQAKLDSSGQPKRYRQYLGSRSYREFPEYNVSFNAYNKRTGFTMGTPPLEPVKEDILALRRIEENVETLIYKSLFPIIHVKVGTDKNPAKKLPNGTSEVSNATQYLMDIEENGGVVTSERVEIKAVGAESLALRVETYLAHFKKRVYAGLGMSAIDFGDGDATGRATGEVLSSALKDSVVDYQIELEEFVTRELFDELLLESGKYKHSYQIPEKERVYLSFEFTSEDEKAKKESHVLNKMQSDLITLNEARKEIGMPALPESQIKQLKSYRIQKNMDELEVDKQKVLGKEQASQQIRVAKATPKPQPGAEAQGKKSSAQSSKANTKKTASGNSKTKKSSSSAASNATSNKVAPKNQHTRDSVRDEIVKSIMYGRSIDSCSYLALRLIQDYIARKVSMGLVGYEDIKCDEVDRVVNKTIADIIGSGLDNRDNHIKLSCSIAKHIDNLELTINNIQNRN